MQMETETETKPASRWAGVRRWLPGAVISLIAIIVVANVIDWNELMKALASFNPLYVALTVLATILFLLARGMAVKTLLEDKVSFKQGFFAVNIGYFLNNIFPLRMGEVGRAVMLGQSSGLRTMHVLSTIIIERAFDLAIAAGLMLSTLPLALEMDWARPVAMITLVVVVAMLAAMFFAARYREKVHGWVHWLGKRIPLVDRFLLPQMDALLRGLGVLVQPKLFLSALFWIALSWLIAVLEYYVLLLSLEPNAPLWWGAFVDSVLALGIAVPSAPGAIGVFEAAVVGAMSILGFTPEEGLAYAVIVHFQQWVITAVLGVYGLVSQGQSITSFFKNIRTRADARDNE